MTSRDNPVDRQYYELLSALIKVQWRVYKDMLERGTAQFSYGQLRKRRPPAYDPDDTLRRQKRAARATGVKRWLGMRAERPAADVFEAYVDGAMVSCRNHALQFLSECGICLPLYARFTHPYFKGQLPRYREIAHSSEVQELIKELRELGCEASNIYLARGLEESAFLSDTVHKGWNTGVRVMLYRVAVDIAQGAEAFSEPRCSLAAKVQGTSLSRLREAVVREAEGAPGMTCPERKYGVDIDFLRSLGLGTALGCPAGARVIGSSVIHEYVELARRHYESDLLSWYSALPERNRDRLGEVSRRLFDAAIRP